MVVKKLFFILSFSVTPKSEVNMEKILRVTLTELQLVIAGLDALENAEEGEKTTPLNTQNVDIKAIELLLHELHPLLAENNYLEMSAFSRTPLVLKNPELAGLGRQLTFMDENI